MKRSHRTVLDTVAQQHIPDDLNLLPQIIEKLEKKTLKQSLRTRPAFVILLLLLSLSILSGVAYALGRSLGYIPGVGIVEDSSGIYMLAEPVSARDRDIYITVNQVIADSTRTFISYKIAGISPTNPELFTCTTAPVLELPDGNTLNLLSGGGGNMESYNGKAMTFETSYIFPPLPAQTTKVTLTSSSPCAEIILELNLVPAPMDFAIPVTEIGGMSSGNSTGFSQSPFPATPTRVPNGSGLYLEKALETESSYILIGNFTYSGDLPGSLATDSYYKITVENSKGETIHVNSRSDIRPNINWGNVFSWAYEIPKPLDGTITLTLEQIKTHQSDTFQFQIDTGDNPQTGDKWELNQPITLFENHYVIDFVEIIENGYRAHWHTDTGDNPAESADISLFMPEMIERESTITGEEIHRDNQIIYEQDMLINAPLPSGLQTFELILRQRIPLQGPWILEWTPPAP